MTVPRAHRDVLMSLASRTAPRGEMCVGFAPIVSDTGMPRAAVRRIVRHLARKGLAEFYKALQDDEGAVAGAGYCVTATGRAEAGY